MAGEKIATSTSKAKNKNMKKNNAEVEKHLVLTPSEKALGIRINQPKQKTIDTMTRLYAVPSEKLRVWTCWLTKVGERADDWQWWIRSQIGLAAGISENLRRATLALEEEKSAKSGQADGDGDGVLDAGTETSQEVDIGETATEIKEADLNGGVPTSSEEEASSKEKDIPTELENTVVPEGGESKDTEEPVAEVSEDKSSSEVKGDENKGKKGKKTKGAEQGMKIDYKEGFWPVGVRWKPLSQRNKQNSPPQRQPDEIPIPRSEDEMAELIKKIKHQGVVYRSLYKHWSKTADEAVKQVIGRTVLPTNQIYPNGEELPFFFRLETEPDIDYVIEHDDEQVLLPDQGRERITQEFQHLYFNLTDKPGKGGKPWI